MCFAAVRTKPKSAFTPTPHKTKRLKPLPAPPLAISVVICTHNRSRMLAKTLASLRAMRAPDGVPWEVCLVDNNSTDDTASVLAQLAGTFGEVPVRRVVEPRQGVAFARNTGVIEAKGDVIAFVDDDVEVDPDWLAVIHKTFADDTGLSILGGRLKANPESSPPAWLNGLNMAPLGLIDYGHERRTINFPYLATANCAFRKQAIVDAGMFDTRLGRRPDKLYADEDTEMVARILKRGGKVVYDPAMLAFHYVPNTRMTRAYFRRWYRERGEGVGLVGTQQSRHLFGIAFYEYRAVVDSMILFCRNFVLLRSTFQQRLLLNYFVGILAGRVTKVARNVLSTHR